MANHRATGPLDPLIEAMPHKTAVGLAKACQVRRNTVLAWQKDPESISFESRLKLQLLSEALGVRRQMDWLWSKNLTEVTVNITSNPPNGGEQVQRKVQAEVKIKRRFKYNGV